jgi:hypothetical protein
VGNIFSIVMHCFPNRELVNTSSFPFQVYVWNLCSWYCNVSYVTDLLMFWNFLVWCTSFSRFTKRVNKQRCFLLLLEQRCWNYWCKNQWLVIMKYWTFQIERFLFLLNDILTNLVLINVLWFWVLNKNHAFNVVLFYIFKSCSIFSFLIG